MKKQTVFSVLLIFLFAGVLLMVGLRLAGQGLREVGGAVESSAVLHMARDENGFWIITFAGRDWCLNLLGTADDGR
ncbi:MAG: hypothetical protein SCK29_04965 [Bacillota bacterium]|nr:hypothetical protein [Bacillota bacterium]MDW7683456.1 hypothetical protein [Bacillota bacterium]